jgi:transcriptional regulator with XRE-family HTH domain
MAKHNGTGRLRGPAWVGPWLLEQRERKKIARKAVADRLKRDDTTIYRLECGDSSVPADDLPIVLRAYGLTPAQWAAAALKAAA